MTKHQLELKAFKERQQQVTEITHNLMSAIDRGEVCPVALRSDSKYTPSNIDHWNLGPGGFYLGLRRKPEDEHRIGWCCTCFAMHILREIANEPKPRK